MAVRLKRITQGGNPVQRCVLKWSIQSSSEKYIPAVFRPDLGFGCEVSAIGRLQQDAEGRSMVQE